MWMGSEEERILVTAVNLSWLLLSTWLSSSGSYFLIFSLSHSIKIFFVFSFKHWDFIRDLMAVENISSKWLLVYELWQDVIQEMVCDSRDYLTDACPSWIPAIEDLHTIHLPLDGPVLNFWWNLLWWLAQDRINDEWWLRSRAWFLSSSLLFLNHHMGLHSRPYFPLHLCSIFGLSEMKKEELRS